MFCQKCGHQLDNNQKFCHKCGAATVNVTVPQPTYPHPQSIYPAEPYSQENDESDEDNFEEDEIEEVDEDDDNYYEYEDEDNDDSFNFSGFCIGLIKIAFIGIAIWALVHYNPSEKKQAEVVNKELAKQVRRNPDALWAAAYVKSNLEYKDLWVVSWTYVEPDGHLTKGVLGEDYVLCSVGFCGIVIPFIEIKTYRY